ncbi:MAG: hypothetical protein DI582_02575 [Azospirillum brasilense]|nr:MAG: hypothetical protein DI582_02575 [Azospirillum brasilense]
MQHAVAVAPSVRNLMKRAEAALQKQRMQEAFDLCQQIVAINPNHGDALHHLGLIYHATGDYAQAENFYRRAMFADPKQIESRLLLCDALRAQGNAQAAIQHAQETIQFAPNDARVHSKYASTLTYFKLAHAAVPYLEGALERFPNDVELRHLYCMALIDNDRCDDADAAYQRFNSTKRFPAAIRFMLEMHLPRVYQSAEHIAQAREKFAQSVAKFTREKPTIPLHQLTNFSLFYLAFHNADNRQVLQDYCAMMRKLCPELNYVAPHCKPGVTRAPGPLRIGVISRYMCRHSVGNCYRGVITHLAAQPEFSVSLFNLSAIHDEAIQELADGGVRIVPMPAGLKAAHSIVAEAALDIIIYPDIGMEPSSYYLALMRLAPHQICLGGHPETTGIDTIDYVVGSRSYEPPHAQENYTERLLCVDGVNTILSRPKFAEHFLSRAELGLPEDRKLYVCPMAIQKFHPDYDRLLADILAADPQATLVLFNDFQMESATQLLQARITSVCDPARVIFLPWQQADRFHSILVAADVLLDTIYFGGGSTAHYAFPLGVPMVTWPGNYARGRCIAAYYDVMGVADAPIADSAASYVALACKVANDPAYRAHLSQQLVANSDRLFEIKSYAPLVVQMMHDVMAGDLERYAR